MKKSTKGRLLSLAATGLLASALTGVAAPALADGWGTNISCGTNNRCQISSTTTGATQYLVDSVLKASWGSGGSHSWNGSVSAGSHSVIISASTISTHNAYCYCPSGSTCGL